MKQKEINKNLGIIPLPKTQEELLEVLKTLSKNHTARMKANELKLEKE